MPCLIRKVHVLDHAAALHITQDCVSAGQGRGGREAKVSAPGGMQSQASGPSGCDSPCRKGQAGFFTDFNQQSLCITLVLFCTLLVLDLHFRPPTHRFLHPSYQPSTAPPHPDRLCCVTCLTRYRHTAYHKQTKNYWGRDDPAFLLVSSLLIVLASCAYCVA